MGTGVSRDNSWKNTDKKTHKNQVLLTNFNKIDRDRTVGDNDFNQEGKGKTDITTKMDVKDELGQKQSPGDGTDDSKSGTSVEVEGAQVRITNSKAEELHISSTHVSQNIVSEKNTCHDKNGAGTETDTTRICTVPREGGYSDSAGDKSVEVGKNESLSEKGTNCDIKSDDVNVKSGDVNSDGAKQSDVNLSGDVNSDIAKQSDVDLKSGDVNSDGAKQSDVDLKSGDVNSDGAKQSDVDLKSGDVNSDIAKHSDVDLKSGDVNSDGAKQSDVDLKSGGEMSADVMSGNGKLTGDEMSDDVEPGSVETGGDETGGVEMGHVKCCNKTDDTAVASSSIINDDSNQTKAITDKKREDETSSDRTVEEKRDENNEKKFDASEATESEEDSLNLRFYRNEIYSRPFPGEKIDDMLQWKGNYLLLERLHSYIQWLFPIPESRGMNYSARALQEHEAKAIREDETLRARVLEAFKMMLDFYGMQLVDDKTGEMKRADNWQERYEHLDRSFHNRFRITRILKALGELGFEHLQEPWLRFIMHEATVNHVLPNLNGSCMDHWIGAIKDENKHDLLYSLLIDLNDQLNKRQDHGDDENLAGSEETDSRDGMQDIVKEIGAYKNVSDDNRHTEGDATAGKSTEVEDHVSSTIDKTKQNAKSEHNSISRTTEHKSVDNNDRSLSSQIEDHVAAEKLHQSSGYESAGGAGEKGQPDDDDLNGKADRDKNEIESNESVNRDSHNPAESIGEQSSEIWSPNDSAVNNDKNDINKDNPKENRENKILESAV